MENYDKFLNKMKLASISVLADFSPYSFSVFYAYDFTNRTIIFASSSETSHIKFAKICTKTSGTIALDTKIIGKIKGIQFLGEISIANEKDAEIYFKKFPYAKILKPELFKIKISWLKFTDNSLGFGTKIEWKRN